MLRMALVAIALPGAAAAQAPTPQDHPGALLADSLAAVGCVLHQDDTNLFLFETGIQPPEFPPMAISLIEDGILASTGNGTLTLVNWGPCEGDEAPSASE